MTSSSLGKYAVFALLILAAPIHAEDAFERGLQFFKNGKTKEALVLLNAAHARTPENKQISYYLGRLAFEERRFADAILWFGKSIDQAHCEAEHSLWLGRAYGHRALEATLFLRPFLAKKVLEHFRTAVACDPEHLPARWDLMEYYVKAPKFLGGDVSRERGQAKQILQLDAAKGERAFRWITENGR